VRSKRRVKRERAPQFGDDIRTVEFGCPIGMSTCRPMGEGLFEVRTNLGGGRIARVLFTLERGNAVLLQASLSA
jgi:putative component of toxin-antitoxin plasmid stabilization module